MKLKVKCPAKINLTLEILDRREDGFHNLKSIMQAISLYDILTVCVEKSDGNVIELCGTSTDIPYDSRNLVHKAAQKFLEKSGIENKKISIHIEKNIPIEAGLAGGSTDGAGTFFALNKLFENPLSKDEIEEMCASLGSDLNFCLNGATALCTSRGEKTENLPTARLELCLIKPLGFGISAKEAYTKFSQLQNKSTPNNTDKMAELLRKGEFDEGLLYNSLEIAVIDDYPQLQEIKSKNKGSMMSGSGPTFFVLRSKIDASFDKSQFLIIENLKTISHGVEVS